MQPAWITALYAWDPNKQSLLSAVFYTTPSHTGSQPSSLLKHATCAQLFKMMSSPLARGTTMAHVATITAPLQEPNICLHLWRGMQMTANFKTLTVSTVQSSNLKSGKMKVCSFAQTVHISYLLFHTQEVRSKIQQSSARFPHHFCGLSLVIVYKTSVFCCTLKCTPRSQASRNVGMQA